ncbi:protein FAF-like, chloroplastic [Hordeum vulgare subsp. vulgare]|uniref:FAF domain-containing protein n=1 Tax=Hordeum vulgare subsp. vulgare TaxID=112509 RepID=A0A8I6XWL3_HORVV|nr:protein FAF-like, chloroplastic [Hordeum vulgare subsp. vulgare]
MSVAVCRGPAMPSFETPAWLLPAEPYKPAVVVAADDRRPAQVDIWNAIQADVDAKVAAAKKPYVSPRVRRSMSQKSLEVCTESLGCETGSGDFTASLDAVDMSRFLGSPLPVEAEESLWESSAAQGSYPGDDLVAVNYHSSAGRRSPRRSFPPPLPSMSSRDGPCLKMCSRRQDGRLVVEAVAVRPRGYLQATRQDGRLCLSFIECSARGQSAASKSAAPTEASYFPAVEDKCEPEQEVAMQVEEEEEDEEEVEVVDRGTVVEVKVSSQPQAPAAAKVHRSTLVINKFVGSTPFTSEQARCHADAPHPEPSARDETPPTLRRVPSSTTTLAAAVAVASTETGAPHTPIDGDDDDVCGVQHPPALAAADTKQQLLLFTSRRGDKHDLLQSVRRCRQLRQRPLFILEQYCIATS